MSVEPGQCVENDGAGVATECLGPHGEDFFDWNTALSSIDAGTTTPAFVSMTAGTALASGRTVFELIGTTIATQSAGNVVAALGASATTTDTNSNVLFVIYTTGGGAAVWN